MSAPTVFALLDETAPNGVAHARSRLYTRHAGTLSCNEAGDWPQLLARLQEVLEAGLYAVPVLSYELGEQLLGVAQRKLDAPLAQVLLFERYEAMDGAQVDDWLRARTQKTDGPAGVAGVQARARARNAVRRGLVEQGVDVWRAHHFGTQLRRRAAAPAAPGCSRPAAA